MQENTNCTNKNAEIHVTFNSSHELQHRALNWNHQPVPLPADPTVTLKHPSQGLSLFMYITARQEHWLPIKKKKKSTEVLPIALHKEPWFHFSSIFLGLKQSLRVRGCWQRFSRSIFILLCISALEKGSWTNAPQQLSHADLGCSRRAVFLVKPQTRKHNREPLLKKHQPSHGACEQKKNRAFRHRKLHRHSWNAENEYSVSGKLRLAGLLAR